MALSLADSNGRSSRALISLSGNDLVVERSTQIHAKLLPRSKVVGDGDGAGSTLGSADGPVLLEGSSTFDGSRVGSGGLENIVGRSISGNRTLKGGSTGRIVVSIRLNDVVFDHRIKSPSVDGEIAVSIRGEGAGIGN